MTVCECVILMQQSVAVHFVGLGGVGMRALGQLALDLGLRISGSDRSWEGGDTQDEVLRRLQCQGAVLMPQDGSGVAAAQRVVISSAIEPDNPDWVAARRLGTPVEHRAAFLERVAPAERTLAVAGTCGKSTTTAILGWVLAGAGLDPVVVNGAAVPGWEQDGRLGCVRHGRGRYWVLELDESDRSLMRFHPAHAILTNVSADHFPESEARALFAAFRAQVRGVLINGLDADGPSAERLAPDGTGAFCEQDRWFQVPLLGRHNLLNAWLAVRMALALGAAPARVADALLSFPGVERRLQRVGDCGASPVYDDYAHNPAKLKAVWETLSARYARVVAVWRPHGFGPLRAMLDALAEMFAAVCRPRDRLLLLPVYDAGGTADRTLNAADLARRVRARGGCVELVADLDAALKALQASAAPDTVLVTLGARDPDLPRLARRLASTADH